MFLVDGVIFMARLYLRLQMTIIFLVLDPYLGVRLRHTMQGYNNRGSHPGTARYFFFSAFEKKEDAMRNFYKSFKHYCPKLIKTRDYA